MPNKTDTAPADSESSTTPDQSGPDISEGLRTTVVPRPPTKAGRPPSQVTHGFGGDLIAGVDYPIPQRPEPPPIPNGWYAIASSRDLAVGDVAPVIAVGRELVVYRDERGAAHVADAHCPHLGAHLGGGRVIDDTIRCPYHGWRFDPAGTCVDIPYSEAKIPSRACLRTYLVIEQDGFVFFWYHASGAAPTYEIPRVDEVDDPSWSNAYPWKYELVASLQEMAENNVDYAHLRYVHQRPYVPNDTSTFHTDGPFSTVIELLPDGQEFYRHAWGPGVAVLRVPNLMTVFTTTTPIDRRHCRLHWHFLFKGDIESMAADMIEGVTGSYGLHADVPIWRDKIFLERPILVKADGNIAEFRRWYSQFYDQPEDSPAKGDEHPDPSA